MLIVGGVFIESADTAAGKHYGSCSYCITVSYTHLILPDEYRNGKAFDDFTPRIIYLKSRRHSDSNEMRFYDGKLNHLWVDIFILDNISDSAILDKLTRFKQKVIYGFAMSKRCKLDMSKYNGTDRLKVSVLAAIGKFVNMRSIFRMQEALRCV